MTETRELRIVGYERVLEFREPTSGLRGILAIHSTALGPALGGVRVWTYASEEAALADALKLSRAMSHKTALAELPGGGAKAVILANDLRDRRKAFECFGAFVASLNGTYVPGPDVGFTDADWAALVRGMGTGGSNHGLTAEDLGRHTAEGVWQAMRAAMEFAGMGGAGRKARVAIQGAGSVGMQLARILKREGMELAIADLDGGRAEAARALGAQVVSPGEILFAECDVVSPCALGGVMTREIVPRLKARIVCGSANNILADAAAGEELMRRGIVYVPDYLANAGGVIRGAEVYLWNRPDSGPSLARIYERTRRVLEAARERGVPTVQIADEMAEARIRAADLKRGTR